jgi:hypothetical protein
MKLRYRGRVYFTQDNPIETVAIDKTARFLGQNYTLRRPLQTFNSTNSTLGLCKYRGVEYSA